MSTIKIIEIDKSQRLMNYPYSDLSQPIQYIVRWINYDRSVLMTETYGQGELPVYKGEIPTKPSTPIYTYVFDGWSPEISIVESDVDYTATYVGIPIERDVDGDVISGSISRSRGFVYRGPSEFEGKSVSGIVTDVYSETLLTEVVNEVYMDGRVCINQSSVADLFVDVPVCGESSILSNSRSNTYVTDEPVWGLIDTDIATSSIAESHKEQIPVFSRSIEKEEFGQISDSFTTETDIGSFSVVGIELGSGAETSVDSVEIIKAGVYLVMPPISSSLQEIVTISLNAIVGTYHTGGLFIGANLVTCDSGGYIPIPIAAKSAETGEWSIQFDHITVTEDTPVTVIQYNAFTEFFKESTEV